LGLELGVYLKTDDRLKFHSISERRSLSDWRLNPSNPLCQREERRFEAVDAETRGSGFPAAMISRRMDRGWKAAPTEK
jgi:hypothetical protein